MDIISTPGIYTIIKEHNITTSYTVRILQDNAEKPYTAQYYFNTQDEMKQFMENTHPELEFHSKKAFDAKAKVRMLLPPPRMCKNL